MSIIKADVKTCMFTVYAGYANNGQVTDLLQALLDAWDPLGFHRLRLFFAGRERIYTVVSAELWEEDSPAYGKTAVDILSQEPFQCCQTPFYPHPQKRWKTTKWQTFKTREQLETFIERRNGAHG